VDYIEVPTSTHRTIHQITQIKPMYFLSFFFLVILFGFLTMNVEKASAQPKTKYSRQFEELAKWFIEDDDAAVGWLQMPEEKVAYLSGQELRLLRNHIFARKGVQLTTPDLKAYFTQFSWYKPRKTVAEIELVGNEEPNVALIKAFENAKTVRFDKSSFESSPENSEYLNTLNGCWQAGSSTVGSGYAERFVFDMRDKSFAFKASQAQGGYAKKLGFSGRFELPSVNVLELDITSKDRLIKVPGAPYRDPETKKNVTRTGLKLVSDDLGKEHEFKSVAIGGIRAVNIEANLTKFILMIDGVMYWRVSNDAGGCD
jgi:hypothetical protein